MRWHRYTATAVRSAMRAAGSAVDLLMPRLCVFCGIECRAVEAYICAGCASDLPWLGPHCPRCAEPLPDTAVAASACGACQVSPPPFTAATALLHFEFPVDAAIRAFKFRRRLEYGPAFAALLEAGLRTLPDDIDALLPVPLHWRRQLRRGFNQASELCAPLAAATGLPIVGSIKRVRPTPYQSSLGAAARRRGMHAAFVAGQSLRIGHVLIIDDVMTTGTTCRELARVALAAGAAKVSVMALARAVQPGLKT